MFKIRLKKLGILVFEIILFAIPLYFFGWLIYLNMMPNYAGDLAISFFGILGGLYYLGFIWFFAYKWIYDWADTVSRQEYLEKRKEREKERERS